ncbi:MAG: hypothetical protein GF333_03060, partial [Candidatus Omnitrophica bacterium]|nr:hypothetical protein [Candidatus Omnitrophota bacterium]
PMEVYPFLSQFHIARIFGIAMIIGYIVYASRNEERNFFFNAPQDKVFLGLLFVILFSITVGWAPQVLNVFEQMAKNLVVYAVLIGTVTSQKRLKILLWMLMAFSAILAFNTVQEYRFLQMGARNVARLGGFSGGYFGGAGDFAVMMCTMVPFAYFFGVGGKPAALRPVALFFLALFIAAVVATHARAGVLVLGALAVGFGIFGVKNFSGFKKFLSVLLVAGAVIGTVALAPAAFKQRAASIAHYQEVGTATARIEYWKIGIKMFLSNPLIGVGAGNYPLRYWDFGGWEHLWRVPHNMYIEALSELGMLGFGCLFFLLYYTFKQGLATLRLLKEKAMQNTFLSAAAQGAMLSLFAYCVGGMFQSLFTYPVLYILIAIVISVHQIALKETGGSR